MRRQTGDTEISQGHLLSHQSNTAIKIAGTSLSKSQKEYIQYHLGNVSSVKPHLECCVHFCDLYLVRKGAWKNSKNDQVKESALQEETGRA